MSRLEVRVPRRFNGPPGSGNGGWSAGVEGRRHRALTSLYDAEGLLVATEQAWFAVPDPAAAG